MKKNTENRPEWINFALSQISNLPLSLHLFLIIAKEGCPTIENDPFRHSVTL